MQLISTYHGELFCIKFIGMTLILRKFLEKGRLMEKKRDNYGRKVGKMKNKVVAWR